MGNVNLRNSILKVCFLLLLGGISFYFFDRQLLQLIAPFTKEWRPLFKVCTFLIFPPLHLALWGSAFLYCRFRKKKETMALLEIFISQCLTVAFVRIFKVLLGRARPDIFMQKEIYGFFGVEWDHHYHSFPSGHTMTAFALATSLALLYPRYRWLLYGVATLLSFSRPLLLDHYLGDVCGTAALGILIATALHSFFRSIKTLDSEATSLLER